MSNKRVEYLDSLRGLTSLTVVSFHALVSFTIFYEANYNQNYENLFMRFITETPLKLTWGGIAVLLFFALSGYVLTNMFSKPNRRSYPDFIGRKFIRIYVPYIIIMMISVVLVSVFYQYKSAEGMSPLYERRWDHMPSLSTVIAYIFMLHIDTTNVNGVVWTLYHEMRISIIFPVIAFIILKLNFKKSIFVAILFSFGTMGLIYWLSSFMTIGDSLIRTFGDTFFYSFYFFIGGYLCRYKDRIVTFYKNKGKVFVFATFFAALILIANWWMYNFINISQYRANNIVAGIGMILLFISTMSSPLAQKMLGVKFLKWTGKISYSTYLTHMPVIMLTTTLLSSKIGMWQSMICALLLVLPVANIFYKLVEVPSMRWSNNFSNYIAKRKNRSIVYDSKQNINA